MRASRLSGSGLVVLCALLFQSDAATHGEYGIARIACAAEDALLYVDGEFQGCLGPAGTTMDVVLPAGERQFRVAVPGHPDLVRTLAVNANERVSLRAVMSAWLDPGTWTFDDRPVKVRAGQVVRAVLPKGRGHLEIVGQPGERLRLALAQRRFPIEPLAKDAAGANVEPAATLGPATDLHDAFQSWELRIPEKLPLSVTLVSARADQPNGIVLAIHRAPPPKPRGKVKREPQERWTPPKSNR